MNENERILVSVAVGLSTVELVKLWQSVAPSLEDVRCRDCDDTHSLQRIMDANYLGVGLAVMVGGTLTLLTKSWLPLLLAVGSVSYTSWWYRQVLYSEPSNRNE